MIDSKEKGKDEIKGECIRQELLILAGLSMAVVTYLTDRSWKIDAAGREKYPGESIRSLGAQWMRPLPSEGFRRSKISTTPFASNTVSDSEIHILFKCAKMK